MGTVLGILLAIGIVHSRVLDKSLMPWVIASQTIPILAIAPMIIVVLNAVGISGSSAQGADLDLSVVLPGHRRHGEGPALAGNHPARPDAHLFGTGVQTLWKLRLPSAVPYLFASMKIGVAASWSAPSSANCRPARSPASARVCWPDPTTARPYRSGRR
jgi:NitT/TauT family transport system permease protein